MLMLCDGCEHRCGENPGFDDAQGVDAVEVLVSLEVVVLQCPIESCKG